MQNMLISDVHTCLIDFYKLKIFQLSMSISRFFFFGTFLISPIFFQPMDSLEPASSMPSSSASPGISSDNYDDLTSAEDFSFPWKQREILTFDIPVHDSERAGLGVSVKGKTSTNKGMYDFHEK